MERAARFEGTGDVGWGRWRCIMPHLTQSRAAGGHRLNAAVWGHTIAFLVLIWMNYLYSLSFLKWIKKICVTDLANWISYELILIATHLDFGSSNKHNKYSNANVEKQNHFASISQLHFKGVTCSGVWPLPLIRQPSASFCAMGVATASSNLRSCCCYAK